MPTQTAQPSAAFTVVRDYHQRTKHRFEGYAKGPETLDWDAQPAPFREFTGTMHIPLRRLADVAADSALAQALQRPFAALDTPQAALPLTLDNLAALLQLSLGLTAWKTLGPDRWAVRANPSSGNLHPTEAYVLISGLAELADGLYHYCPQQHALELRASYERPLRGTQLGILLTSVMWRETWKYGERAFRYCQLDTGHAVGALRYAAAVLGWQVQAQLGIGQQTLAALAGVDRLAEFPARKSQETESEEAELLLTVGFGEEPEVCRAKELQTLAASARWYGSASTIDRHPMYRWPVIGAVAAATRQPDQIFEPLYSPVVTATARVAGAATQAVGELINTRRSAQRFDHEHVMPYTHFASLIARLQPTQGAPWDVLAEAPRAALVFFVSRVEGLEPGLYLLPRRADQLTALRDQLDPIFTFTPVADIPGLLQLVALNEQALKRTVRSLHCMQDIAATACFALGMLFDIEAVLNESPTYYRRLYHEAGLIGQVLYLEAEAHGLRGTGIGCFFDDPVHQLLGLSGETWQSLYHFTVGLPITDPRIESTPAYLDDAQP